MSDEVIYIVNKGGRVNDPKIVYVSDPMQLRGLSKGIVIVADSAKELPHTKYVEILQQIKQRKLLGIELTGNIYE